MAVNKNFVVKNGLEVDSNLILADANTNRVGIGTTIPEYVFHVNGGIGATTLYVTGVSTFVGVSTFSDYVFIQDGLVNSGVTTSNAYVIDGTQVISNSRELQNIASLDATTTATIEAAIASGPNTFTDLTVTGVSTFVGLSTFGSGIIVTSGITTLGVTTTTDLTSQNLNVSGVGTITTLSSTNGTITNLSGTAGTITTLSSTNGTITNLSGTIGTITTLESTNGTITNLSGTIGTITTLDNTNGTITNLSGTIGTVTTLESTNGTITNLSGTIGTIGQVQVFSGIITASSGIVTYYGDGQYLDLTNNSSIGIGIGTTGGVVGYGITFIDFYGAGVSTSLYDSNVGIATIFFEGGGGGGSASIGIGSTPGEAFPTGIVTTGNLWYHKTLGRLFIYYQDDGDPQWVDAAPFNIGIITSLTGGISFSDGTANSPSWYFVDDQTTGVFSPTNGELTFVSIASSVLNINPGGINVTGVVTATSFVGNLTGNADTATYATSAGIATYATSAGIATYATSAGIATYATSAGIATYATSAGIATDLLGGNAGVNTTSTPTNLYVSGNAASNIVGLGTTNANTTLDFTAGNNFSLTLTGSIVLTDPTGITTGQSGIILVQQDGTGSHTVGFGSHWDFPSATAPTLSTGANALDVLTYFVRNSTSIVTNSLIGIGTL